jgi:hypothetical protein
VDVIIDGAGGIAWKAGGKIRERGIGLIGIEIAFDNGGVAVFPHNGIFGRRVEIAWVRSGRRW